jgi:hypothetical protein
MSGAEFYWIAALGVLNSGVGVYLLVSGIHYFVRLLK